MHGDLMTASATDGESARFALSTAERLRCSRLPTTGRSDFRAGRLAAKRAASGLLGALPVRSLEIGSGGDAPPTVTLLGSTEKARPAPVELSISHRDGRAVAAAAPAGLRVGVDLERSGSIPARHARYFLSPVEMGYAADMDLTVLWSLKEAAWKALRLGRDVPFKTVQLCTASSGALTAVRVGSAVVPLRASLTEPWPGYHMAMVWMSGGTA